MEELVVLVDEKDNQVGLMPKMEAHEKAVLHRAFSVFIFNSEGKLMLQQRAADKYHSPLLWTNTCCSHQREGETNLEAGKRRLEEEMGFTTDLKEVFWFVYKAPFENGLTEHELDHVMVGYYEEAPKINKEEVASYKWMTLIDVKKSIEKHPKEYTEWFKIIFDKSFEKLTNV
jgi:isopentenyl-diphosphate delta-isomerase|tara:strand:+ start:1768 stop:2286 length:519 start_codon:yes stop_codon:yes gene_type:complete